MRYEPRYWRLWPVTNFIRSLYIRCGELLDRLINFISIFVNYASFYLKCFASWALTLFAIAGVTHVWLLTIWIVIASPRSAVSVLGLCWISRSFELMGYRLNFLDAFLNQKWISLMLRLCFHTFLSRFLLSFFRWLAA